MNVKLVAVLIVILNLIFVACAEDLEEKLVKAEFVNSSAALSAFFALFATVFAAIM